MAKENIDDRFKKFGSVSFIAASRVNDFIDYLDKGDLTGTHCPKCGRDFFPPRADCFNCLSSDLEWFKVENTGGLAAFSTLKYAPSGFEKELPYTIAVLDYGKFRVFGRTDSEIPPEKLFIGMKMKSQATRTKEGQLSYIFLVA